MFSKWNRLAGALAILAAVATRGATSKVVKIEFPTCPGVKPGDVKMAQNGDDSTLFDLAPLTGPGVVCTWMRRVPESFSTATSHFSFRIGVNRTGCYRPDLDDTKQDDPVAVFVLACCGSKGATVTVEELDPGMELSYLRIVPMGNEARRKKNIPVGCTESGVLKDDVRTVTRVVSKEKVRLQFRDKPDPFFFGLLVNDLPAKPLTRDGVLYQFIYQRGKGIDGSGTSLSPNAIEVDALKLRQTGLKRLKVTVK
ncbi:MAG TPA: hypothetical protein VGQ36_01255 [Thermoanaerobaculia bacterium]|jgi:hypothetical protein|nr:hypothetical protein [Thermoanaerobaculia bacterium]